MDRISRFLFPYLSYEDACNLAVCSKTIVSESVPVSWVTRKVVVSSKGHPLDVCASSLVVMRPNMSRLENLVRSMPDLREIVLIFTRPKMYYDWIVDLTFFKGTLHVIGHCPQTIIFDGTRHDTPETAQEELQESQDGMIPNS